MKNKFYILVTVLLFVLIFIILIIYVPMIKFIFNIVFSENTGFYFYSALLQANAAILSIIGIFSIFKIQSLQSSIHVMKGSLLNDHGMFSTPTGVVEFDQKNISEKEKYLMNSSIASQIKGVYEDWLEKEKKIVKIKSSIKTPTILLAILIILFSLLIILSGTIHNNNFSFEIRVFLFSFISETITIILLLKGIINIIKE